MPVIWIKNWIVEIVNLVFLLRTFTGCYRCNTKLIIAGGWELGSFSIILSILFSHKKKKLKNLLPPRVSNSSIYLLICSSIHQKSYVTRNIWNICYKKRSNHVTRSKNVFITQLYAKIVCIQDRHQSNSRVMLLTKISCCYVMKERKGPCLR